MPPLATPMAGVTVTANTRYMHERTSTYEQCVQDQLSNTPKWSFCLVVQRLLCLRRTHSVLGEGAPMAR